MLSEFGMEVKQKFYGLGFHAILLINLIHKIFFP